MPQNAGYTIACEESYKRNTPFCQLAISAGSWLKKDSIDPEAVLHQKSSSMQEVPKNFFALQHRSKTARKCKKSEHKRFIFSKN